MPGADSFRSSFVPHEGRPSWKRTFLVEADVPRSGSPHTMPGFLNAISLGPFRSAFSRTCQESAIGRYREKKFTKPNMKRRRMTSSGTSCPPSRTRAASCRILRPASTLGTSGSPVLHFFRGSENANSQKTN